VCIFLSADQSSTAAFFDDDGELVWWYSNVVMMPGLMKPGFVLLYFVSFVQFSELLLLLLLLARYSDILAMSQLLKLVWNFARSFSSRFPISVGHAVFLFWNGLQSVRSGAPRSTPFYAGIAWGSWAESKNFHSPKAEITA